MSTRLRSLSPWLVLAAIVALSTAIRALASRDVRVPWIAPDEMIYGLLGRSLYRSGELAVLGGPTPFYSFFYPALVGLPLSLDDLELGFRLLQVLQALVMSLAAVPVYLWGRTLMPRGWALLASALTLAIPALAYSGLIMSETLFYPVMVVAAWAMAEALARPTPARQALLIAAIVVAITTRVQAVVLLPVLLTALVGKAALDRAWTTLRRFGPTFGGLGALAAAWSTVQLRDGGSWTDLLGGYGATARAPYEVADAARFVAYHGGDVLVLSGIFPACAVVLLALEALRAREPSHAVRAYLAVVVSYAAWLVVEVGVFASHYVDRIAERDLITLAPLLFLGFALWLARGGIRPRLATSLVAVAAAGAILSIPFTRFVGNRALHDALTFVPIYELTSAHPDVDPDRASYAVGAGALLAFALLPRRLLMLLPAAVALALGAASISASREITAQSRIHRSMTFGVDEGWVDATARGPVAYLYDGEFYFNAVWHHVFWNRRITWVLTLPGAHAGPIPQRTVRPRPDGRMVAADGGVAPVRYVVASTAFTFAGTPVRANPQEGVRQRGLVLWKVDQPLRLSTWTTGVYANGDMENAGRLTVFACERGELRLLLRAKESRTVRLIRDGELVRTIRFRSDVERWRGAIPARPAARAGRTCRFEVRGDDLLGSTRFEFVRA